MGQPANQPDADAGWRAGPDGPWPYETRGVVIAGENPMIVLYRPGRDDYVAIASMWTSTWSEAGQGRALVIWADAESTGLGTLAPVGIFTDNPELAHADDAQIRIVVPNGAISFHGHRFQIGKAFGGQRVGMVPTAVDCQFRVLFAHQPIALIDLRSLDRIAPRWYPCP